MSNQILTRESCTTLKALSILMVITHHLYFPIIGKYFGFTACALFFLISGYGLTKSMDSHEWDYEHLKKSILKLLRPYLFFWLVSISVLLIFKGLASENVISFFTLGFPNLTGWFYRTIIAIYIICFITRRVVRRYYMEAMFVITLLYVMCVHDKLDFFWWNSIICFPLGILVAKHQEFIERHKNIIMLCSLVVFGFCMSQIGLLCDDVYTVMGGVSWSILLATLSNYFAFKSRIIDFIGKNSLELYMFHCIPCYYITYGFSNIYVNYSAKVLITFVFTFALIISYQKILKLLRL